MSIFLWIGQFILWFFLNFIVLVAWFIMINNVLDSHFRYTVSTLVAFIMVVLTMAIFVWIFRIVPVPFEVAIYARFLSFVLSYVVARDVSTWIPETWKFRRD